MAKQANPVNQASYSSQFGKFGRLENEGSQSFTGEVNMIIIVEKRKK